MPSHYLNQCLLDVSGTHGNKLHGNLKRNTNILSEEMKLKMSSAKWQQCCLSLNASKSFVMMIMLIMMIIISMVINRSNNYKKLIHTSRQAGVLLDDLVSY